LLSVVRPSDSLLLASGLSSLSLGNTSDLLDSALDFLSLLAADLTLREVAVLYNNNKAHKIFFKGLVKTKILYLR
jgi:hypothetical protein